MFNVSIIVLGLCLIAGAVLLRPAPPRGHDRDVAMVLLVFGGIGAIGVGLFPEDVNLTLHSVSAALAFAGSNVALILLGSAWMRTRSSRGYGVYSVASGALGLIALGLFGAKFYGPLGVGGMERLIIAPVLLWAVVVSMWLISSRRDQLAPGSATWSGPAME